MKRFIAVSLVAVLALTLLPLTPGADAEQNPDWSSIKKDFKDNFKVKNPISQRRKGVSDVAKSRDPRGVAELMKALKRQEKHIGKMRDEWAIEEEEWAKKTERLEAAREERIKKEVERAQKKGREPKITIDLNSEDGKWLGLPPEHPGEMQKVKDQLQKKYRGVLAEEDFTQYVLRSIAKILNALEGPEFDKAVAPLCKAAIGAAKRYQPMYVKALGYTKGPSVTKALEKIAGSSNVSIQMMALESIGRQNADAGKAILFTFLDDERWQVRAAAIQGLAFYRDVEVMDRLLAQAIKEEGAVRRRCFGAMSVIVGEKVKGTVESWQSWWQSNKDEWTERWAREPRSGMPVQEDPPVIAVDSDEGGAGTSFYGLRTDSKHIIFVVDISGSMRHKPEDAPEEEPEPIAIAKRELINAVKSLSAVDEDERGAASFNIVVFATQEATYKAGKMVIATKKNKEAAFKWIEETIVADGMTNAFDALEAAFNIIGNSDKKNMMKGADTIFFMTDGRPNRGKFFDPGLIVDEITRMNKERKITIHAIGVGKGVYPPFLQALAANNNGKYLAR